MEVKKAVRMFHGEKEQRIFREGKAIAQQKARTLTSAFSSEVLPG
jgi:hypothetical protein